MELFGTAGIRGPVTEVTPALALTVGRAVGTDIGDGTVVLARDGRETGEGLVAALEAGLLSAGVDIERAGMLPTPALAAASRGRHGIMVTASHNPPGDNGIKLFRDGREFDREAEQRVESLVAAEKGPTDWDQWGRSRRVSVLAPYREECCRYAREHGEAPAMRVVVDCGNGMASLATPQVLETLGADILAMHANVDSHFSARPSKPTPESLTDLRTFVADDPAATVGIGHDGDADRIVIVDGEGEVVHEDTVLAILAAHYTRESDAGDPVVVTTPNASARIDEQVRAAGGRVERVRLGALHEGISTAREHGTAETRVVFAAEPWKHIHPALGEWIDGVASAAVFTRLVAEHGLDRLREPVTERPYRKVSIDCPDEDKAATMERLAVTLPDAFPEATVETEYGVRLELPDGSWTLVRPSGTEPYIRLYAESDSVDELVAEVRESIESAVE